MEAVHLNYQFFHQNESCSSKSGLVKIIIWIDKLWKIFWGCAPYAQSSVFLLFSKIQHPCCRCISACKKATVMVFIWGDRGYPAVRFEYKTASERYLVAELSAKQFWVFWGKIEIVISPENTPNCFAYISATKYRSEAVLYSKLTAGYPLSPEIKTIAVAFLQAE